MCTQVAKHLPNDLKLMVIGNWKIFEKSQDSVDTYPVAQFLFQKQNFGNYKKQDINILWCCPVLLNFFTLFQRFFQNLSVANSKGFLLEVWSKNMNSDVEGLIRDCHAFQITATIQKSYKPLGSTTIRLSCWDFNDGYARAISDK